MPAKKRTKTADTAATPLASEAVLRALRSNLKLLGELAARYEVNFQPERPHETPTIACPRDAYELLGPEMKDLAQEQLRVLLLNVRNGVIGQRVIYQGNVNSSAVRPAEVFRTAIIESAPSIVISHNHPSGDPTPSPEDVKITRELVEGGKLLDIAVMDHLIIAGDRYVSLKQKGLLTD
ncbi:MAG: DNA repair protein RadC [Chloroflexi bacterium]|nr:DNA repair protein RadC [Chloroflexota bacterium]